MCDMGTSISPWVFGASRFLTAVYAKFRKLHHLLYCDRLKGGVFKMEPFVVGRRPGPPGRCATTIAEAIVAIQVGVQFSAEARKQKTFAARDREGSVFPQAGT